MMKFCEILNHTLSTVLDGQGGNTETDKWDNHNAIARGWKNIEDNYKPVTFRRIYGVDKQAPLQIIKTTASAPQLGPSNDHHPDQDYDDEAVGRPEEFNTDEADL